ncbi:hypothetical protein BP5796_09704 [Coleophoma crateriformis]|uniref:Uncharacterized protein n=1 Tax=Coleophoma crateriformis TaxID=565419 RepID=A0A3D8QYX3_9HELO|nr:hypothetical protein BP5796_09704 [Coleophoma crateriformis]
MASIDDYFASRQSLWGEFSSSNKSFLTVSEVWHSKDSNSQPEALHRTVKNRELSTWLDNTETSQPMDTTLKDKKCVLRVAWVPHDRKQGLNDVGAGILEHLTRVFHHQLAQLRFRATFAGAASLIEPSNGRRTSFFCNHPNIAVTWSQCTISGLTSVICIADQRKIVILQDLLSCKFIQALANLEPLPALMCSILCCREIDSLINTVKHTVRQVEVRTGHHTFMSRSEPPATGDLLRLSADMSGCISNLAVNTRRLGVLRELNKFIIDKAFDSQKTKNCDKASNSLKELISNIKTIQKHSEMQKLDVEFFASRAQIQRDALVHLIAEHELLANQELAKDTRRLAVLAQKDSAGIKALTIVATLFIPPTFVSSLFSMPLFDWGSAGTENHTGGTETWKNRLLLYLTVTGPLMLVTFSVWGLLILVWRLKQKKEVKQLRLKARCSTSQGSEVISLVSKRMSGISTSGDSEALLGQFST